MPEAAVRLDTACAWRGSSLLVTTTRGECGHEDPLTGFYVREVRHLRTLRLELNGERPWMCEWSRPRPEQLAFVYVHPELARFGGGGSGAAGDEVTYPRSNTPQTWNASALPLCIHARLGLLPYAPLHALVVDPVLPPWLSDVELRGLRVGGTRASLRFWRDRDGGTHAEVLEKDGPLHLVRQPPPEALRVGLGRRLRALIAGG